MPYGFHELFFSSKSFSLFFVAFSKEKFLFLFFFFGKLIMDNDLVWLWLYDAAMEPPIQYQVINMMMGDYG